MRLSYTLEQQLEEADSKLSRAENKKLKDLLAQAKRDVLLERGNLEKVWSLCYAQILMLILDSSQLIEAYESNPGNEASVTGLRLSESSLKDIRVRVMKISHRVSAVNELRKSVVRFFVSVWPCLMPVQDMVTSTASMVDTAPKRKLFAGVAQVGLSCIDLIRNVNASPAQVRFACFSLWIHKRCFVF